METLVQERSAPARLADLGALLKSRQTLLLLFTGLCAYMLTRGASLDPLEGIWMTIALLLSISGCTVLNMLLDQDIDAQMERTAGRPLPAGRVSRFEATVLGGLLSVTGLALAFTLDVRFGTIIAVGFAFDLLVYTAWLKRRTPFSIVFGGIAGGMPVLAGRVLALGRVDLVGLLLAASILCWIPSHILTLAIRYADDYRRAGVPVWPNVYGRRATRLFIAAANLLNTLVIMACTFLLKVHAAAQVALLGMSVGMFALAVFQLLAPTEPRNWRLFKLASLYCLASSLLLTAGTWI